MPRYATAITVVRKAFHVEGTWSNDFLIEQDCPEACVNLAI